MQFGKIKTRLFREQLGAEGREIVPAGAQYYIAKATSLKLDNPLEGGAVYGRAKEKIARRGIVLEDDEILLAMDHTGTGRYLTKDIRTLEEFGELLNTVEEKFGVRWAPELNRAVRGLSGGATPVKNAPTAI